MPAARFVAMAVTFRLWQDHARRYSNRPMTQVMTFAIPVAMAAVMAALLFGLFALFRGGDFGRSWSNKAMRMRVVLQFVAIAVLLGALLIKRYMDGA
jgi:hypothetical protein